MMKLKFLILILVVVLHCWQGDAWRRRRRRRRAPTPVSCAVSGWSSWKPCSVTCSGGTQTRSRSITRHPAHGGSGCPGLTETRSCNLHKCPIPCSWGSWSQWSECSACWPTSRSRTREVSGASLFGGQECPGNTYETDGTCVANTTCIESRCNLGEFTCSDGLTCIRNYLRCNGDDDCTDYSDEYGCKHKRTVCRQEYSGIPNIDLAGAGYDIIKGSESGNIFDNRRYNGRCLTIRSGDHGKRFRQPANIQFYRFQVNVDTSFVAQSYESAKYFYQKERGELKKKMNRQSSFAYKDIFSIGGKVGKNSNRKTLRVIEEASSSDSKYFKISSGVRVAQFRVLRRNFILSIPFRQRLAELPDHYDYAKYAEVIHDFGTHFYSSGVLGGKYEFIYRYSRAALRTSGLTDTEQKNCLKKEASFSLFGFKLGGGNDKCSTNSLSSRNNGSFTKSANEVISNVRGGTSDTAASLSFFNTRTPSKIEYDAWVQTVKNNPAIIDFTLSPISNTLTGQKRRNMQKALYVYLKRFDPAVCKGSCDNGGSFVVVENGKVCKCLCAAGYTGSSCTTKA